LAFVMAMAALWEMGAEKGIPHDEELQNVVEISLIWCRASADDGNANDDNNNDDGHQLKAGGESVSSSSGKWWGQAGRRCLSFCRNGRICTCLPSPSPCLE